MMDDKEATWNLVLLMMMGFLPEENRIGIINNTITCLSNGKTINNPDADQVKANKFYKELIGIRNNPKFGEKASGFLEYAITFFKDILAKGNQDGVHLEKYGKYSVKKNKESE